MLYIACLLSGVLIGFLIKDYVASRRELVLNTDTYAVLKGTKQLLTMLIPLSPDAFIKEMKENDTGIGFLDGKMFLVQIKNRRLITLSNIPLKNILEDQYDNLKIVSYLPKENELLNFINRVNRIL